MKPGDLCKLVSPRAFTFDVEVGLDVDRSLYLPLGTLVIYVGRKQYNDESITLEPGYWDAIDIIVNGTAGWVYFHELEPADETR